MGHRLMSDFIPDLPACYRSGTRQADGANAVVSIVFPDPGQLRSRKVISRSNARPTGKYPSWKMGRMLQWESENELRAFRLLDCEPDVTSFNEQPCEVEYVLDGQIRRHYPDILVEANCREELWEVKPESKASAPEVAARTSLLVHDLPKYGYTYRVLLAEDLAMQPRLKNDFFLLRFGRRTATDCEWESIRRTFNDRGSLLWSDACSGVYGPRGRETLCSLVLRGVLTFDTSLPILPSTQFVTRKGDF